MQEIPIRAYPEEEFFLKLDAPHHPTPEETTEAELEEEYDRLYDLVEVVLGNHGKNDSYGDGDYTLEPYVTENSRALGFMVSNAAMITPQLIHELAGCIRTTDERWEIYIGSDEYDYGILISTTEALVYRREDASLPWPL